MRPLLLPFLALAFISAGCSSVSTPPATAYYRTGTISSKWGELPTYSPTPEGLAIRLERRNPNLSGEATVDLLLNREGQVKDWNVVSSADNHAFQREVGIWVKDHRFGPRLAASDPAPYVLRITFEFSAPGASKDQYHQSPLINGPW